MTTGVIACITSIHPTFSSPFPFSSVGSSSVAVLWSACFRTNFRAVGNSTRRTTAGLRTRTSWRRLSMWSCCPRIRDKVAIVSCRTTNGCPSSYSCRRHSSVLLHCYGSTSRTIQESESMRWSNGRLIPIMLRRKREPRTLTSSLGIFRRPFDSSIEFSGRMHVVILYLCWDGKYCRISVFDVMRNAVSASWFKVSRYSNNGLRVQVVVHKTCTCLNMQYSSGFITSVYLFTKLLYMLNVVLQLLLMNHFLRTNKYDWYGIGIIQDIISGVKWETSGFFPRVSICDFEIRQMANIQKYSVQCVLVINMFNEKIFVLLWFWYAVLFASSLFSIASWFLVMVFPCFSRWFVSQHLELSALHGFNPTNKRTNNDVARFVHSYLHRDGVFVLRMLSAHAGVIFTTDLVCALYRAFYGIEECAESQDEAAFENRNNGKKLSVINFEGGEITTSLMPGTPPDEDSKSETSSTSSKKD
ncbi:hypothetical protein PMAYCL1PPCAC_30337 [Pristionchus mayeri]|uniref:Innexin n=1 Tax=Pristionchus mayeri TaxID=1317129 RepID=A0AAN5DDE1_9BILA|nr:hypothetical protein PMAYCL1PPCAC_30337 [Pristionchus mayeri]